MIPDSDKQLEKTRLKISCECINQSEDRTVAFCDDVGGFDFMAIHFYRKNEVHFI